MTIGSLTDVSAAPPAPSDDRPTLVTNARPRGKRRNLSEQQKRELVRLYSETTTALPEIKSRFGIAESSLYRLLQQRGVAVRGRVGRTAAAPAPSAPSTNGKRAVGRPAKPQSAGRKRVAGRRRGPAMVPVAVARAAGAAGSYLVSYAATQVVTAENVLDALRQVQGLGATEILQIQRAD